MTNYKLTTNLIVDCMALIPENLELLNEDYDFFASGDMDVEYFYNGLHPRLKFLNLSHCLRTIQEFQEPNPLYIQAIETYNKNWMDRVVDSSMQTTKLIQELKYAKKIGCKLLPKTIASATLHGQGEYPPSTLEDLCESYKNVMKK